MYAIGLTGSGRMLRKTKISKGFQTVIPSAVRINFGVEAGDYVEWEHGPEGLVIRFRKHKRLRDLAGVGGAPSDAVKVKKRVQRGMR
jgi:AbrB family looped-hinge helix DNA binding protein